MNGAQRAVHQLLPLDGSNPGCAAITSPTNFTATGLAGCSASVTCSAKGVAAPLNRFYLVNVTGSCSGANATTSRQIEVMIKLP